MHLPKIILGGGQGGLLAARFAKPGLVEAALATRNVQREEVSKIGQAWGNVGGVIIRDAIMT